MWQNILFFFQGFKNTNQNIPLGSQDQIQTGGTVLESIDRELAMGNKWTLPSRSYSPWEGQLQDKKDAKEICFLPIGLMATRRGEEVL